MIDLIEKDQSFNKFHLLLGGFEGPIDLLLILARSQKVDLSEISISELADQYISFINEYKDIPRIKKIAAPNLAYSWQTIPHVTHHDEADVTELENFRNTLIDNFSGEKKKITPLVFIIKSLIKALKKFPNFNSSIDKIENGKMTLKKYFHIGIAVDTPHGLMVPKLN